MKVGILIFNGVTPLDFFGPWEIVTRVKAWEVKVVACEGEQFFLGHGVTVKADEVLTETSHYDILILPGGFGQIGFCDSERNIRLVKTVGVKCKYLLSVCTGSLILGMCGFLAGKKAVTHWQYQELLSDLGAIPVDARIVDEGSIITSSGVSAGIDMALYAVAKLVNSDESKRIQLSIEYAPEPPFNFYTLRADQTLLSHMNEKNKASYEKRKEQTKRYLNFNQ